MTTPDYAEHSKTLNRICWKVAVALGEVTEDDERCEADPDELIQRFIERYTDLLSLLDRVRSQRGVVSFDALLFAEIDALFTEEQSQ